MPATLVLLVLLPILALRWASSHVPGRLGLVSGVSLGLVVSPASLGLYALAFIAPLIGMIPALGGVLTLLHGWPGFHARSILGLRNEYEITTFWQHTQMEAINAGVWGLACWTIGMIIDYMRASRSKRR